MQETRRARLQSVIQEELSALIQREIKDPRVPDFVTLTSVEVNPEGDHAIVYVSTLGGDQGDAGERVLMDCVAGLVSATPFFRRHLAKILSVRHIPNLVFRPDRGLANAQRVGELLMHIQKEPKLPDEPNEHDNLFPSDTQATESSGASNAAATKKTPLKDRLASDRPPSKYQAKLLAKEAAPANDTDSDTE